MPDAISPGPAPDSLLTPAPAADETPRPEAPAAAPEAAPPPANYSLGLEELLASDESLAGLELDKALEADFRKMAQNLGLQQKDAGAMAQMYARHQARQNAELRERQQKAMAEAESAWLAELKADKNFAASLSRARAAVQSYGSPELMTLLEESRLGSHPALVRFMARVGAALAEPAFARGQHAEAEKSPAEVLYPGQGKN